MHLENFREMIQNLGPGHEFSVHNSKKCNPINIEAIGPLFAKLYVGTCSIMAGEQGQVPGETSPY